MKFLHLELIDYERFSLKGIRNFKIDFKENLQLILGTNGSGKAQPLNALIKVPGGWKKMKEMKVGTEVITKDGSITKVNGVFPQGLKDIYKVTFADGRSTECCAEHLWRVYIGGKQYPIVPRVINTLELIEWLNKKTYGHLLWIDLIDSEQNDDIELPIDPYFLGVFLGDGTARRSPAEISTPDDFIIDQLEKTMPADCILRILPKRNNCKTVVITKKEPFDRVKNSFTKFLNDNNLNKKYSYEKSIPEEYLYASTQQRLSLLQGLMDTDGYIDTQSTCSYTTTSYQLAIQVRYLIRSLGGIANIVPKVKKFTYRGEKKVGRKAYQINIRFKTPSSLFRLPKKKERANDDGQYCKTLKLQIKSIEKVGRKTAQCISVEHPSHLYVTNSFIVTHNTSLLEQLTPLPPDPKDFLKTGKKKIIIEHNGNIYTLTSIFSPKVEHSFIINNETELNDGGTVTIQKELVKQHFNITPEIQELILGTEKFSSMSFSRRKEWFIKLCDTNYDYAIKVFNKLKDRHRDITGAIKLAKKRLVIETEKLIKQDEEEKLLEEIRQLHNTLNILLEIRKPIEKDIDNILLDQDNIDKILLKYSNTLSDLINQVNNESLNIDEIDSLIKQTDMEIFSLSNHISRLMEEHRDNLSKIVILQRAEEATIDSIKLDIVNLTKDYNQSKNNLIIDPIVNTKSYLSILDSIKVNLIDIFNNIPINNDKRFSQDQLNISKVKLESLTLEKNNINSNLNDLYTKIKHMENHKDNPDTECPSCKHKFSINYNPSILNGWKKKALELEQRLNTEINKKMIDLESYIDDCTTFSHYYRQYIQLNKSWGDFNEYWNYLNSNNVVTDNPRYGITLINLIENDILNQIKLEEISLSIKEKKDLLNSIEQVGGADLNTLINRNNNIDIELEGLTNKQTNFVNKRKDYVNRKSIILSVEDISKKIKTLMYEKRDLHKEHLESLRRIHFNNAIRELQSYLASKENILNNYSLQKSLAEDISFQIVELEKNEKALSYLMVTLSPTEGLIAEGLLGFINVFISQMNHFIKRIWTYPLVINTCGIAEGDNIDIDYKFPLVVGNNRDKPVVDISKGSTGMLEIINLAFRITAMQYLGLSKYPLPLDEWGSGFDTIHREQAVNAIKSLVDQNIFDQLFVISHYAESYGALSNPDICVLDDTNITLPKLNSKVNKNVVIN